MNKYLLIIADDFGIGPDTTRGILDLGLRGVVTGSVLLVNSPHAESAVTVWRELGQPVELGWHANLTLDGPVLAPAQVPSLVRADGSFWPLGAFLSRLSRGKIQPAEVRAELEAQWRRFGELVGGEPALVNTHHHLAIFPPIGAILLDILARQKVLPYVRRVREPWTTLVNVPGARIKRLVLSGMGRRLAGLQAKLGFPGNDWLLGNSKPACVKDPRFFRRWLESGAVAEGDVIELVCHPGHMDRTLVGRDCGENDGMLQWRLNEWRLLKEVEFRRALHQQGWQLLAPNSMLRTLAGNSRVA